MSKRVRRGIAMALSLALVASSVPTPALAQAAGSQRDRFPLAPASAETSIELVGDVTDESTVLSVSSSSLPAGARLYVAKFTSEAMAKDPHPGYGAGDKLFDSNDASWFTFDNGEKRFYIGENKLAVGEQVIAYVLDGWTIVTQSAPVEVVAAGAVAGSPAVTITSGELTPDSTSVSFEIENLPEGCMAALVQCDAGVEPEFMAKGCDNLKIMNATTGLPKNGANTVALAAGTLAAGKRVVVFLTTGYAAADVVASSEPVTVAAGGQQPNPQAPTRQQIIDACAVEMDSPHAAGAAAGAFTLTDTSATVRVRLHESVTFAWLTVYAYPKAAIFDPDNATYNRSLYHTKVRDGDSVGADELTADFGDGLAALDTTYNLVAYLYFQVPPEDNDDYQYKTSRSFELVDAGGQTTEPYAFPNASIVEDALPVGARALHANLTGDARLFQLARDTANEWLNDKFTIHVTVRAYKDDGELFDLEDNPGDTLWGEEATAPFENREIALSRPLQAGERVIAVVYWTNYTGEHAAMPVPRGNDYGSERVGGRDSQSVPVTDDAPPVALEPRVAIDGALTTATTRFDVEARNLPDGALLIVKRFAAGAEITYGGDDDLAVFSPYRGTAPAEGANAVTLAPGRLAAGDRVVAFVLAGSEVVAQSEPASVTEPAAPTGSLAITTPEITSDTTEIAVNVDVDVPAGALLAIRSYSSDEDYSWSSGTQTVGVVLAPTRGENRVPVNGGISGTSVVAFLFANGGSTIYASSEPAAVAYAPAAPSVSIGLDGDDVALTQGDRFVSMTWSVDPLARNVSYDLYQFVGDELDTESATRLAHDTLVVSSWKHAGSTWVVLGGALVAGAKLQAVLTADGVASRSNTMTVGATPAWAKVTPTIAFEQPSVRVGDTSVRLQVSYPDEYRTELGDQFYADVKVYLYPGSYTDDDFEDRELDEKPDVAHVVAGANSSNAQTNGALELTLSERYELVAGQRLIAKVRLPQAERQDHDSMWEDYLSMSIPVVAADADVPPEMALLYNLGADTAKGERLRGICESLGLAVVELGDADLPRRVGELTGHDGYGERDADYEGAHFDVEYLLMANLSEASLDRLLSAMREAGVVVGAKGVTTDTNLRWALGALIGDVAEEHEVITALVDLQQLVGRAKALDEQTYGAAERWGELQAALAAAQSLYTQEDADPTADELKGAYERLEAPYLAVSGLVRLDGRVRVSAEPQADGSFALVAAVEGASAEGLAYAFAWNDGSRGATLEGVAAGDVGARVVTVSADGALGTLEGRLLAPETPTLVASLNPGRIDLAWDAAGEGFNRPAADGYVVELWRDGERLALRELGADATATTFEGLAAGDYVAKACARNLAGRSDKDVCELRLEQGAASVAGVTVSPAELALAVGETARLEAAVEPAEAGAGAAVSWASSDEAVARVDADGTVVAVGAGVATISASAGGASGSAQVTVSEPAPTVPHASATAHVQNAGWKDPVGEGVPVGSTGRGLRLEAFSIELADAPAGSSISYRSHVQNVGWERDWSADGDVSGTTGSGLRVEAVQIRLDGPIAADYDVWYQAHVANIGWMGWARNGVAAGTTGLGYRIEALRIRLVPKGGAAPAGGTTVGAFRDKGGVASGVPASEALVGYSAHVQGLGWLNESRDGEGGGTQGQSRRLEALSLSLGQGLDALTRADSGIMYRSHVQNVGWERGWHADGALSGSTGSGLRMEAVQVRLYGSVAASYDVWYRVHVQNVGWMGWAKDGGVAGTTGRSLRIEAIEVRLVRKGDAEPVNDGATELPCL